MANKGGEKLKDRIKNFLGVNREKRDSVTYQKQHSKEFLLTAEILKDISPESPANNRLKTIKELAGLVASKKLEENAVEALWCSVKDLVQPTAKSENRHEALHFLQALVEGQLAYLGILRAHFFHVIQVLNLSENLHERLALFKILSENGRNVLEFEEEAGLFLLEWMPTVLMSDKLSEFLELLVSIIKYNAAYLDEEIISGLVQQVCTIPSRSRPEEDCKLCLDVLDAVVCYSYLPSGCLQHFISALCQTVNMPKFSESSWELMRKLLGTHLGHSSVYTMCIMLQDRRQPLDSKLLRGAVFFLGMALWGSRKVSQLKHTPAAVLPSFLQVLSGGCLMVAYEVVLSVNRLVKKYGKDLTHITWDLVLDIVVAVLKLLEVSASTPTDMRMSVDLHDILSTIEGLYERGQFAGSVKRFFQIIEMCANKRPESSVVLLIAYQAQGIHPGRDNWVYNLYHLLDRYFRNDTRTKVRVKALDVLSLVLSLNKHMYEEDLVDNVVLPHMCHIDIDEDTVVRRSAVEILLSLAQTSYSHCYLDIIGLVEKIICRPMSIKFPSPYPSQDSPEILHNKDETDLEDIKTAITLLTDLFKTKLYSCPSQHCLKVYNMLVSHMTEHYNTPSEYWSHTAATIRRTIVECLLQLRSDTLNRVGVFERAQENQLPYSPYVFCKISHVGVDLSDRSPPASPRSPVAPSPHTFPSAVSISHLDYSKSFSVFIHCLENEKNWEVLKCVLENLPLVLQNKTIILSPHRNMVDILSSRLCAMVNDRQLGFPEKLVGVPVKFTRSDFHGYVFPVLAAMVTYHTHLDRNRQRELINCLEFGMVSKCAKMCVNALRLCTLEMQEVMLCLLPSVLLQLSKISATVSMAIPVLAFLSSIVRLPKVYANFVEDEYMSVFAIALPYTNPFKFSHYTVSLAHHVIAIWFIRCRLPFRKGFVPFIQKGLKANVLQLFEENARQNAIQTQNQDSSDRTRSGSLSEQALRRLRERRRRMQSGSSIPRRETTLQTVDEKMSQFHRELTETLTDVMSRYTFCNFFPQPHRSPMAEFLLAGGQQQTWLLGNKLITITTSGGGTKLVGSGVCEKCSAAYQTCETKETKPLTTKVRRRHKSAIVVSQTSSVEQQPSSRDDLSINQRSSDELSSLNLEGQDVGVQTGSSLSSTEPLESLILGLKASDPHRPKLNICNCWCTNWAEIYIRAPSGDMSWMMRIENETDMYSVQDTQGPDITSLFACIGGKAQGARRPHQNRRIDSGSVGEEEYESLYAQHFPSSKETESISSNSSGTSLTPPSVKLELEPDRPQDLAPLMFGHDETEKTKNRPPVTEARQIPKKEGDGSEPLTPGSLRRSNSSPSVLSGSSGTFSPRETSSEVSLQFGWPNKDDKSKEKESSTVTSVVCGQGTTTEHPKPSISVQKLPATPAQPTSPIKEGKSLAETKLQSTDDTHDGSTLSTHHPYHSMLSKQLTPSPASSESSNQDEVSELPFIKRLRGHTISVVNMKSQSEVGHSGTSALSSETTKVGISPSFVFLQLYHGGHLHSGGDTPILLKNDEISERSIMLLDHIYPFETHKIGIVYVGPGQVKDEREIMMNQFGSERYDKFIQSLGHLIRLRDCESKRFFLGGLDTKGTDGEFTYGWQDESTQLIFHIATLMKHNKSNVNLKKLHIGNNFVNVVYNDSGEDYNIGVMMGQFNFVNIVIKPLDYASNAVTLQAKEVPFQEHISTDIAEILGHKDTKVISDDNLPSLVRQIGIHCNLASMVLHRQQSEPKDPFASNWLERLRKIRRIHDNASVITDQQHQDDAPTNRSHIEDFTKYV